MSLVAEPTFFDLAIAAIFLFLLIRGAWIGCMRQLAALFALVGGYFLAGRYTADITPFAERFLDNPKLTFLLSFLVLFLVAVLVFNLAGKVLQRVMQVTLLGWFDRLLGVAVGAVKAVVLASLLYLFLASTLSSTNDLLRRSLTSPFLKIGAEQLQLLINDPRLRGYFVGKEPAILPDLLPGKARQEKEEKK